MNSDNDFHIYLYGPDQGPIDSSFEETQSRLEMLPRLHFEPDGSFVWALDSGKQQVFGMIYDAGGKIQYTELRGRCAPETWSELCFAITGSRSVELEILQLPDRQMQDLQSFEKSVWPATS